jgi:hypothetical protein
MFGASAEAARDLEGDSGLLEEAIGRTQEIAVRIVNAERESLVDDWEGRLVDLERRFRKLAQPFGGRWAWNACYWRVAFNLKVGRLDSAAQTLIDLALMRRDQTALSGWVSTNGYAQVGLAGLLGVLNGGQAASHSLSLLSRALLPILKGNKRAPEGIRDFLLGFEIGMKAANNQPGGPWLVDDICAVRRRILDGVSFLDPFRAGD